MINCSDKVDLSERQLILSKYAQKLINSGHSVDSTKIIIVQGVTKYVHKLKRSELDRGSEDFAPLYLSKEYQEKDRQVTKYLAEVPGLRTR